MDQFLREPISAGTQVPVNSNVYGGLPGVILCWLLRCDLTRPRRDAGWARDSTTTSRQARSPLLISYERVPVLPHVIMLTETRQALISFQDYRSPAIVSTRHGRRARRWRRVGADGGRRGDRSSAPRPRGHSAPRDGSADWFCYSGTTQREANASARQSASCGAGGRAEGWRGGWS